MATRTISQNIPAEIAGGKVIPASVCILTKNSAATLRRALQSVRKFDDIVICDGGSTDETLAIAREFNADVCPQDRGFLDADGRIVDYAGVRNGCLAYARHDWVLYLDSDEEATSGLVAEIRSVVSNGSDKLFWKVPSRVVIDGREVWYSSSYPGYQFRFFNKKSGVQFIKPVHERLDISPDERRIGVFKNPWRYFGSSREIPEEWQRERIYQSSLELKRMQGKPYGVHIAAALRALRTAGVIAGKSMYNYLMHGFRDSAPVILEWNRFRYQLRLIRVFLWKS